MLMRKGCSSSRHRDFSDFPLLAIPVVGEEADNQREEDLYPADGNGPARIAFVGSRQLFHEESDEYDNEDDRDSLSAD